MNHSFNDKILHNMFSCKVPLKRINVLIEPVSLLIVIVLCNIFEHIFTWVISLGSVESSPLPRPHPGRAAVCWVRASDECPSPLLCVTCRPDSISIQISAGQAPGFSSTPHLACKRRAEAAASSAEQMLRSRVTGGQLQRLFSSLINISNRLCGPYKGKVNTQSTYTFIISACLKDTLGYWATHLVSVYHSGIYYCSGSNNGLLPSLPVQFFSHRCHAPAETGSCFGIVLIVERLIPTITP